MFWTNFSTLCADKNLSPNAVATELKIPSGSITAWRNGATPRTKSLTKIANYFGVTVDYLLNGQKENAPGSDAESEIEKALAQATPAQRELISSILDMNENQLLFVKELVDKAKRLVK